MKRSGMLVGKSELNPLSKENQSEGGSSLSLLLKGRELAALEDRTREA